MRTLRLTGTVSAIVIGLILLAQAMTIEAPFALLFGWISFLSRVLPEVKPNGPVVLVGLTALVLFAGGIHGLGRAWRPTAGRWKWTWTAAVVLGGLLLFSAGIAAIGTTHQVAWLATSDQPLVGESLGRGLGASNRKLNEMKQISLGMAQYEGIYQSLPPGGTFTSTGEQLHSWETHILPFIGYSTTGIDMNRSWSAPGNEVYFKSVLPTFINPEFRTPPLTDKHGFGLSHYAANSRVLSANHSMKLSELANGASNTILMGEVNAGFQPWGHPANWRDPAAGLHGGPGTFGGPIAAGGATFGMADGSVRFIGTNVSPNVLLEMSDPRRK